MNKKYVVRLTSEERTQLQRLVSVGKAAARKLLHTRILLQADEGAEGPAWKDERIAEALSAHPAPPEAGPEAEDLGKKA